MNIVGASRDETIAGMKKDLNVLAQICVPEVYEFPFPPMHRAIWQMLVTGGANPVGLLKLAIGLPRGFAKTLLLKLMVIWLILFSQRRFILVVCNTAPLAENFLADVQEIMNSPNIINLFGDWRLGMTKDSQPLKKFVFAGRPITLAALGAGSSLRGLNLHFVRPDVILMDDMQSREEAESTAEADHGLQWMLGTLMKARHPKRCMFVFVGNMYPFEGCILKKLKHNPGWTSLITGAILEDGESIWPELRSVDDILDELENDASMGHPEIFYSEVMNDEEAGNRAGIDISKIHYWKEEDNIVGGIPNDPEAGFVIIDPAAGKKKGNAIAVGVFFIFSGVPVLWDLKVGTLDPKQQIEESLAFAMKYGLNSIIVESVAYQQTLVFWMNLFRLQRGLTGLNILEIYPGIMQKTARILAALKQLVADKMQLALHPRVKNKTIYEIIHYNPLKQKNTDDILDLLGYAYPAMTQFGASLLRPFEISGHEAKAAFENDLAEQLEF